MTIIPKPPEDTVDLTFDPIHEGWSIYKTRDDVLIKIRQIMLKILLAGVTADGNAQLVLGNNLLFSVTAPPQLKGALNDQPITNEQIIAAIVERNIPFETVKEDWNEYDVQGIKVGVKVIATVLAKTNLFDSSGQPVYYVNYQNVVRAITDPEDKAKFQKIWTERQPTKRTS